MRTTATITDQVERNVEALKRISNFALLVLPELEELIKNFNGKKIYKATGGYTQAFDKPYQELMTKYRSGLNRIKFTRISDSWYLEFDCWISFGEVLDYNSKPSHSDGNYYKVEGYIANFDKESKLVYDADKFANFMEKCKANLTVEYRAIADTRAKIKELYEQIERLNSTIPSYARVNSRY